MDFFFQLDSKDCSAAAALPDAAGMKVRGAAADPRERPWQRPHAAAASSGVASSAAWVWDMSLSAV
jgi:hypothetical protein